MRNNLCVIPEVDAPRRDSALRRQPRACCSTACSTRAAPSRSTPWWWMHTSARATCCSSATTPSIAAKPSAPTALVFNAILNHDHLEQTGPRPREEGRQEISSIALKPSTAARSGINIQGAAAFGLSRGQHLCHAVTHGKQRQRQERNQEGAETQAETGTSPQARDVHPRSAEVDPKQNSEPFRGIANAERPSPREGLSIEAW